MYDSLDRMSNEEVANGLAVRFCRDMYVATRAAVHKWHAVPSLELRLNASKEEAQVALKYAVRKGWLDPFGDPIFAVMLLEPGRALFANADVALPRRTARP